jgi:hypothetical protein
MNYSLNDFELNLNFVFLLSRNVFKAPVLSELEPSRLKKASIRLAAVYRPLVSHR